MLMSPTSGEYLRKRHNTAEGNQMNRVKASSNLFACLKTGCSRLRTVCKLKLRLAPSVGSRLALHLKPAHVVSHGPRTFRNRDWHVMHVYELPYTPP